MDGLFNPLPIRLIIKKSTNIDFNERRFIKKSFLYNRLILGRF